MELRVVKYSAEPSPVRNADGTVPLQRLATRCEDRLISRKLAAKVEWPDCCTRVFKRSSGCKITAEATPEPSPEMKCRPAVRVVN